MNCIDYRDLVAAHVDERLSAGERSAVEEHVATCVRCQGIYRDQLSARAALRERLPRMTTPPDVRQTVLSRLQREAAEQTQKSPWRRRVLVGALAAGLLLAIVPLLRPRPPSMLALLAADVHEVSANTGMLAKRTEQVSELRQFYRTTGQIDFERSADDFSSFGLWLVGGVVRPLGGVPTTFTVYDSALGKVVCRRFRVGALRLPVGGQRVGHNEIFIEGDVTIVVMNLGDIICTLSTNIPRDEFLRRLAGATSM